MSKTVTAENQWGPSATYPDGPEPVDREIAKWTRHVIRTGRTVSLTGAHGIGKTSGIEATAKSLGVIPVILSMPSLQIADLYLRYPKREAQEKVKEAVAGAIGQQLRLKTLLHSRFSNEQPWLLVWDDYRRCPKQVLSSLMEVTNEGTIAGIPLENCVGNILIDNPVGKGYQGVNEGDLAFESRAVHVDIDAMGTDWREALAAKYHETDLKPVYGVWNELHSSVREILNPRVLDHLIEVVLGGHAPLVALPIDQKGRTRLIDTSADTNKDVTTKVLRRITEALGMTYRDGQGDIIAALRWALAEGANAHVVGPHGIGKTSWVRDLADHDLAVVMMSAANLAPGDLVLPVPSGDKVEFIRCERLVGEEGDDRDRLIVFDEAMRASSHVKATMLEMFQERTVAGEPLGDNCRGVWALDNPGAIEGFAYDVKHGDAALASRFVVNVEITAADTPWREALIKKFGSDNVEPFLEWWSSSLDDMQRLLIPPRVIEMMIENWLEDMPMQNALPIISGDRIDPDLHSLQKRLDGLKVIGLATIMEDIDGFIASMGNGNIVTESHQSQAAHAAMVLQKAEMHELERYREECEMLFTALDQSQKFTLVNSVGAERIKFWCACSNKCQEANPASGTQAEERRKRDANHEKAKAKKARRKARAAKAAKANGGKK